MLWASTIILSTVWLFGPVKADQNEIGVSGEFAQSGHLSQAPNLEESRRSTRIELISGISDTTWMRLDLPYVTTRRSFGGKLHYDRSGVSTLRLRIGHQIAQRTHVGVGLSSAELELGTPVAERFPDDAHQFAPLGPEDHAVEWVVGHWDEIADWRWGIRGILRVPRAAERTSGTLDTYLLFRPHLGDFYLGPGCTFTRGPNGNQSVEFRLMERLQFSAQWAIELTGFTQMWTVQSDARTGLSGGIRWRG